MPPGFCIAKREVLPERPALIISECQQFIHTIAVDIRATKKIRGVEFPTRKVAFNFEIWNMHTCSFYGSNVSRETFIQGPFHVKHFAPPGVGTDLSCPCSKWRSSSK